MLRFESAAVLGKSVDRDIMRALARLRPDWVEEPNLHLLTRKISNVQPCLAEI